MYYCAIITGVAQNCFCLFSQYEILLCVQDHDDPAIDVCKKLLGKYPKVDARLFIGKCWMIISLFPCEMEPIIQKAQAVLCWGASLVPRGGFRCLWQFCFVVCREMAGSLRSPLRGTRRPACAAQLSCVYACKCSSWSGYWFLLIRNSWWLERVSLWGPVIQPAAFRQCVTAQTVRGDGLSWRCHLLLCIKLKPC